jgi:hypothetical protein
MSRPRRVPIQVLAGGHDSAQFRMRQVVLQWSLGMYVSIPIIALLQGSFHLSEYRTLHADAPRPAMPARGVAVAVERGFRPKYLSREEPLRLLVVGDSLAAGVGMSKSGTPVLPESIARALSKACGGRPVAWTCVGTPGVSASQIVQDIHGIEPPQPGRIDLLIREWKAKRRQWQERREIRRRLTDLEARSDDEVDSTGVNHFTDWWDSLRKDPDKSPKKVAEATDRFLRAWWTQLTTRVNITRERVKDSLTDIQEIVRAPVPEDDVTDDNKDALIHPGSAFTRDSVDPTVAAQYDIAVILTGLNDLKDAFLPHMTRGAMSSLKDGTERIAGGLRNQLYRIVDALDEKMDKSSDGDELDDVNHSNDKSDEHRQQESPRRPLLVVPELPVAPLRLFRLAPLCWFLNPLFRGMENNKKFLSACFPEYVIFVPQPDMKWWSDAESGLGPIRDNIRQERLLLRTTDVAQNVRERIQQLMKKHYYPDDDEGDKTDLRGNGGVVSGSSHEDEHHPHHPHHHSDHHVLPPTLPHGNNSQTGSGSSYVAMDKMHPNDEGYELWGRHIAAAILEHWKKDP